MTQALKKLAKNYKLLPCSLQNQDLKCLQHASNMLHKHVQKEVKPSKQNKSPPHLLKKPCLLKLKVTTRKEKRRREKEEEENMYIYIYIYNTSTSWCMATPLNPLDLARDPK